MNNQKLTKKERYILKKQEKEKNKQGLAKKKKAKKIVIWGVTLFVIVGSLWGVVKLAERQAPEVDSLKLASQTTETDWVRGNSEASVVLVEYADFQCPACASYYPLLERAFQELGENVQFVFRHFPLRQIHKNAQIAGQASEAAGAQGMFWEMHNALYETQKEWSDVRNPKDLFVGYAGEIGLNIEQFKLDMESDFAKNKVDTDYESGLSSGVTGTPSLYLNGEKISNPRNYEELKSVLSQTIGQ